MSELSSILESYRRDGDLVSIERDDITDASVHGIVLDYSNELLIIRHLSDFVWDGLQVLSIKDITSIDSGETNELHLQMLEEEGCLSNLQAVPQYPLSNWQALLTHIQAQNKLIILEDEHPEDDLFFLGRIARLNDYEVHLHYFNVTAEWESDTGKIGYNYITRCQLFSNYANMYESHFKRYPEKDLKIT